MLRGRGRPRLTDEQRADQRVVVVNAARTAIRRTGPQVSLTEIAIEAGISKPQVYAVIGGRTGLAEAFALEVADEAGQKLLDAVERGDVSVDVLQEALLTIVRFAADDPSVYAFVARSLYSGERSLHEHPLVEMLHARVMGHAAMLAPKMDVALLSVLTHGTLGFVFASIESWDKVHPSPEVLAQALTAIAVAGFASVL